MDLSQTSSSVDIQKQAPPSGNSLMAAWRPALAVTSPGVALTQLGS
jgi:hypothetical protein